MGIYTCRGVGPSSDKLRQQRERISNKAEGLAEGIMGVSGHVACRHTQDYEIFSLFWQFQGREQFPGVLLCSNWVGQEGGWRRGPGARVRLIGRVIPRTLRLKILSAECATVARGGHAIEINTLLPPILARVFKGEL